jgi:small subunit ribosomal protein S3
MAPDLEEDVNIRKYLTYRLPNAGVSRVEISRSSKVVTVTIYTARPGIVIGKGGEEVGRLKEEIKQLSKKDDIQINISEGIRVNVAGRLGGSEIARSEKFAQGRVPLHTLRSNIDYALTEAQTQYGVIGIKVWICNG